MSFVINTNVMSLVAQQNLSKSNDMLNQAITRLSSGRKINSAADDAAGQAISNRMTAQITGLTQAKSNANDGISMAQTTEGALDTINDNLQRIRELSVQAANDTNSTSDLQSIQDEIDARLDEIDRVSEQTAFNGVEVLNSNQALDIQVGANDDQTISISLQKINSTTLGLDTFNVAGDGSASAEDVIAKLGDSTVVTLSGGAKYTKQADGTFAGSGTASVSGQTFSLAEVQTAVAEATGTVTVSGLDVETTATTIKIADDGSVSGSGADLYVNDDGTFITSGSADYTAITAAPLETLDDALSQVDNLRSGLGALQNRFDSSINNLSTMTTNLQSARSRIVDANYAEVVSSMSKSQILQQAGTAVLSQANQSQQSVLSLLR